MVEISREAIENEINLMQKEKIYLQELIAKKEAKATTPLSASELQVLHEEIVAHKKGIERLDFILKSLAEQGKIAGSKLVELKISELIGKLNPMDIDQLEDFREKLMLLERITEIEKHILEVCSGERSELIRQLQQFGREDIPRTPFADINLNLLCFDISSSFLNLIGPLSFKDYIVDIDAAIKKIKERK